jgi:hypothetical protein
VTPETFARWAELDADGVPGTWWGAAATVLCQAGAPPAAAVEQVLQAALVLDGDLRPLAALLALGEAPSPRVCRILAAMIAPEVVPEGQRVPPFALLAKRLSGSGGRHRTLETRMRDAGVRDYARRLRAGGADDKAVVAEIAALLNEHKTPARSIGDDALRKILKPRRKESRD